MTRELRIDIRGVVGFVKRERDGRSEYDVVVPNTLLGEPAPGPREPGNSLKAADGTELLRHDPILYVGDAAISLRGHQVNFELPGRPSDVKPYDTAKGFLPKMKLVGGSHNCALESEYGNAGGTKTGKLSGILTIDRGRLETLEGDGVGLHLESLPDEIDGGNGSTQPNLKAAGLRWTVSLEGLGESLTVTATPAKGASVTLTVPVPASGTLQGYLMNHRADLRETHLPAEDEGDPDFKWFYQMLATVGPIKKHYNPGNKGELPYPKLGAEVHSTAQPGIATPCRPCEFCV